MTHAARPSGRPGLTACSLCAGETLAGRDPLPGGQASRLERLAADGVAHLTFSECLDQCERGDVVVARPAATTRRTRRARPVWLERVAGDAVTADLRRWLEAGGPGAAALPEPLAAHVIDTREEPAVVGTHADAAEQDARAT